MIERDLIQAVRELAALEALEAIDEDCEQRLVGKSVDPNLADRTVLKLDRHGVRPLVGIGRRPLDRNSRISRPRDPPASCTNILRPLFARLTWCVVISLIAGSPYGCCGKTTKN